MLFTFACALTGAMVTTAAFAHVKWFSDFTFADKPRSLEAILSPTFWALTALSVVVIALLVFLDYRTSKAGILERMKGWLEARKQYSLTIMKAATAAVLLLSFQSGALFVPDLAAGHPAIAWIEFFFALLLLLPQAVSFVGLGLLGLALYGVSLYGWFHMLDYTLVLGVGYYLFVNGFSSDKVKETGLIALYLGVGFSLCWVAMEKLVFPSWSLILLHENPQLTLGFHPDFFLKAAAFIEFALGYLMMICLLQRPLALVVTLVFFMTTLVFGKTEVVGHTLIHAALIVFLLQGRGREYTPPIKWHKPLSMRILFAGVNFILLLGLMLFVYQNTAMGKHRDYLSKLKPSVAEVVAEKNAPTIKLEAMADEAGGWNVRAVTNNFTFTPAAAGEGHVDGEGHGHIYIDGEKTGRLYGEWFYVGDLGRGIHTIKVQLNTNDHRLYVVDDRPVEAEVAVEAQQSTGSMQHYPGH